jgi:transcriptional regulator with XRE-family HTH domain
MRGAMSTIDTRVFQMSVLQTDDFSCNPVKLSPQEVPQVQDLAQRIFYKSLGARIRELRGSNLSQEQLARAVSLTRTSIVNIESGRQKLLLHNLFRIAEVLCVRPADLISPLEKTPAKIPTIQIQGTASTGVNDWVQRSVIKARKTRLTS